MFVGEEGAFSTGGDGVLLEVFLEGPLVALFFLLMNVF